MSWLGEVGLWWILVTWKIEKSIKYRWGCLVGVGVVVVKHSLSIFSVQCAYQIKNIIVLDPADHVHFSPKDEWAEISPWHCHRFPHHPRAKSWIKHLYSWHHFISIVATYSVSANENIWLVFLTRDPGKHKIKDSHSCQEAAASYNFSLKATREWHPLLSFIHPMLVHAGCLGSNLSTVLVWVEKIDTKRQRGKDDYTQWFLIS